MTERAIGATYAEGRERIAELLGDVSEEEAGTRVPTCPEWTVHDVVAHLAGACTDILNGNIEGVATDPWTAAQVEARRDRPLREVLDEWNEAGPQVEAFADNFPGRAGEQWLTDQVTHEHDIRGALGRPGGRDSGGLGIGLNFLVTAGLASSLTARGLGPLEVRTEAEQWVIATGEETLDFSQTVVAHSMSPDAEGGDPDLEPAASLSAPRFELFRALTGRRSAEQIRAFDWSGEADAYVPAFGYGPFTLSATDVVE